MGLKAAIYTRVSTEEQRDYGYSIDGQLRELKDYCKRKKYDVVDVYNDAGFSGKNMNRPELERLLKDIKKGLIDVIVAIKVDRLTRDGYDGYTWNGYVSIKKEDTYKLGLITKKDYYEYSKSIIPKLIIDSGFDINNVKW